VDVFAAPVGVDENSPPLKEGLHPYGLHRLRLEEFVASRFPSCTVIRLPGLFGEGLKKNVVYDFLHANNLCAIHSGSVFQFYDLSNIHADCRKILDAGLKIAHLAVEPVTVAEIARRVFAVNFENHPENAVPARYDLRTIHAGLWGKSGFYLQNKEEVLRCIHDFVAKEQGKA
jgi:nucleoside-diphosphate-sugar epimerase